MAETKEGKKTNQVKSSFFLLKSPMAVVCVVCSMLLPIAVLLFLLI